MSSFSITETALEGFRVTRDRPMAVLWWWGAFMAAGLLQFSLGELAPFHNLSDELSRLQAQNTALAGNSADTALAAQMLSTMIGLAPRLLAFAALMSVVRVVLSTAMLRAVLRPADAGFGYLRVSMDEGRQLVLGVVVALAVIVYGLGALLVSTVLLSIALGLLGGGVSALTVLAPAAVTLAFLYPGVRLSLAPAMTFADGKISFLRSWPLTKGRFWSLFAAYVLTALLALVVVSLGSVMIEAVLHLGPGVEPAATPRDLLHPAQAVGFLLESLVSALVAVIVTAAPASAFRQLAGRVGSARDDAGASPWD